MSAPSTSDMGQTDGHTPPPTSARSRRPALTVRRSATGYVVHDPALEAEFGRAWLPLPFTPDDHPADVLAHLRRATPGRTVRLASRAGDPAHTLRRSEAADAPSSRRTPYPEPRTS